MKTCRGKKKCSAFTVALLTGAMVSLSLPLYAAENDTADPPHYGPYLELLHDVYTAMRDNYYENVSSDIYNTYRARYKKSVLSKLPASGPYMEMVAYRGAGLLVNALKTDEDNFTNFIPPQQAQEYNQKIYGKKQDIGIRGRKTDEGFLIEHVQLRSDSYTKGVRAGGIITTIDGRDVLPLDEDVIRQALTAEPHTVISLAVLYPEAARTAEYDIVSREYFKETVISVPVDAEEVYCLKIISFNRMTGLDLARYVRSFREKGIRMLILDIRDNPGGPPLAVHELSGFFMPPKQKLFYYKKRNTPPFGYVSPEKDISYDGPLLILVNGKSGSAAELFAGLFKEYKRAVIIGKEKTAGRAFLKSTFTFDDGSMLAMVTGIAYLFNGKKFGLDGVTPDLMVPSDIDELIPYVIDKIDPEHAP